MAAKAMARQGQIEFWAQWTRDGTRDRSPSAQSVPESRLSAAPTPGTAPPARASRRRSPRHSAPEMRKRVPSFAIRTLLVVVDEAMDAHGSSSGQLDGSDQSE